MSLDDSIDTLPDVHITWTGPQSIPGRWNTVVDNIESGSTYSSSLSITPLAYDRDDGEYSCNVVVHGGNYIVEANTSESATIEVTSKSLVSMTDFCIIIIFILYTISGLPPLSVNISTSGLLLTGQSFRFECRTTIVDNLIQLPSLQLLSPNRTSLAEQSNTTLLQYTLTSLAISDTGVYTCSMVLAIPGSGIDRQVSDIQTITVVGMFSPPLSFPPSLPSSSLSLSIKFNFVNECHSVYMCQIVFTCN